MARKRASRLAKPVKDFGHCRKLEKPPRVGLYARVSTHDQQTLPMQLESMRSYAAQRGWAVVLETQEIGSGSISRPKRELLMKAARERILAGISQARKKGTRLGRPRTASRKEVAARELFAEGLSKSEISRRLSISRASVRRLLER